MAKAKASVNPQPLKAYDAQGRITAFSYDGGKKWTPNSSYTVEEQGAKAKEYTRRIAAVAPDGELTPSFERRIGASFGPLGDANILAGWGPLATILELAPGTLDLIVVPFSQVGDDPKGLIAKLREIAPRITIDLDVADVVDRANHEKVRDAIVLADAVTTPSDIISMGLRKIQGNTFTVPPSIHLAHWTGAGRTAKTVTDPIMVALQPTTDRYVADALRFIEGHLPGRIQLVDDAWDERSPADEPAFYTKMDIVVVGPRGSRQEQTNQSLLAPMVAGCCVVADGAYNRTLLSGHSGLIVPGSGPSPWRKTLVNVISDTRFRQKMQRGARERSKLFVNRTLLNQLSLPYRVLIKIDE